MNIIRFVNEHSNSVLAAITDQNQVYSLPFKDFLELIEIAEQKNQTPLSIVKEVITDSVPMEEEVDELKLTTPIDAPEVWAAGVTYEKSKQARNYEATEGKLDATTFYDKVYDAKRPEIFLKSTSARTVGPDDIVYLRSDSTWQIPEPELGLVIDSKGKILGYTIGNDMSCRDIEGENPLYLPQAKIWKHSCSIGPSIRLTETVGDPYDFDIFCRIYRDNQLSVEGSASTRQLKRSLEELISYLVLDNDVFDGTVLLTGTCIVPPNEFTLEDGDMVEIEISQIGVLRNQVKTQSPKLLSAN